MSRHVVLFISEGTADAALVADFPDEAVYRRDAADQRHLAVRTEHVRPWLAGRTAVHYAV
jgi:hypothetical protein